MREAKSAEPARPGGARRPGRRRARGGAPGDPRNIVLKNFEEIVVAYGTKAQLPSRIPKTFAPFERAKQAARQAQQQASATPTPSASAAASASASPTG